MTHSPRRQTRTTLQRPPARPAEQAATMRHPLHTRVRGQRLNHRKHRLLTLLMHRAGRRPTLNHRHTTSALNPRLDPPLRGHVLLRIRASHPPQTTAQPVTRLDAQPNVAATVVTLHRRDLET